MNMFFPGTGMLTDLATNAAIATLPEPLRDLVKDMKGFKDESRQLSDRLMDPINGPVLPYCIKNTNRMFFCSDITADIVIIAAGGTGLATLAETIVTQPSMIFEFMTEAIIPEIDAMAKEGKTMYQDNLNYVFKLLLDLSLDDLKTMTSSDFVNHIATVMSKPEPDPSLMPQKMQRGGQLEKARVKELKDMCLKRGLKVSGKKADLIRRIQIQTQTQTQI